MFNKPSSLRRWCMRAALVLYLGGIGAAAQAQTEIYWWHAMSGALGDWVHELASDFNASQNEYKVLPIYKGSYDQVAEAAMNVRAGEQSPHIVQVYEIGTASMMANPAVRPIEDVMKEAQVFFSPRAYVPAVASYYTTANHRMVSQPFNSSTTVLHYNRDTFEDAGLDPNHPPATWGQLREAARKLKAAGYDCPLTTSWVSWTQLESFSTWHNLPFATKNNGFDGTGARLLVNTPLHERHIQNLLDMSRQGLFIYKGRGNKADEHFISGECAMITASSSLHGKVQRDARFRAAIGPLPYYKNVKGAPQNTIIGGASLWVMKGKTAHEYKGVAQFMAYLMQPQVVAESHRRTGYLPITLAAAMQDMMQSADYYRRYPGADVAVQQMIRKTTTQSRGIRLGNFTQIRAIVDEELEAVWAGQKPPREALDAIVTRGNHELQKFQQAHPHILAQ